MKKTHVFSVVCLALALSAFLPARAQVYEALNLQAQDVIVRNATGNVNIVYGYDPQATNGFFVLDDGSGTIKYFYLNNKMFVKDMEIDGSMVYFCGSLNGNGAIGFFNWTQVFLGSGIVTYIPCITYYNGEYYVHVTEYTKLDFFYDNGNINYALVGNAIIDQYLLLPRTIITSAWPSSTMWYFCHFYNKDGAITYTDIAALNDAVVAVGDSNGTGCYWKGFRKNHNFTSLPLVTALVDRIDYVVAAGPSLITHLANNEAAVVHHGSGMTTVVHQLEQNFSTGRPQPFDQSYCILPLSPTSYGSQWQLYDLRFKRFLYLLENADHQGNGIFNRWILKLPLGGAPTSFDAQAKLIGDQMSLSVNGVSFFPFTSGASSLGLLSKYDPIHMSSTTNCNAHTTLTPSYGTPTIFDIWTSHDNPIYVESPRTFPPVIQTDKYQQICN